MQITKQDYVVNNKTFEAVIAFDDSQQQRRPVVLVAHDWSGRNAFVEEKAQQLAARGYVGVALDLYGKGILGETNEEKMQLITPLLDDRLLLRQRLLAGFALAQALPQADSHNIAIIGYCFGGLCALDLARSGVNIRAAVSFHGLFTPLTNIPNEKMQAKVLAFHGDKDPMVPAAQVRGFEQEMTAAEVDWQLHVFGNTLHAFTNPLANDHELGTVYNASADKRSWHMTELFFDEIFAA